MTTLAQLEAQLDTLVAARVRMQAINACIVELRLNPFVRPPQIAQALVSRFSLPYGEALRLSRTGYPAPVIAANRADVRAIRHEIDRFAALRKREENHARPTEA